MTATTWTEAHVQEAYRAILRAGAVLTIATPPTGGFVVEPHDIASEAGLRDALSACGMIPSQVRAVVSKVCGLAEGRLVRETSTRCEVRTGSGGLNERMGVQDWGLAKRTAARFRRGAYPDAKAVRVHLTRIRRA